MADLFVLKQALFKPKPPQPHASIARARTNCHVLTAASHMQSVQPNRDLAAVCTHLLRRSVPVLPCKIN